MSLLFSALLTISTETLFWSCFRKYRKWYFLLWSAVVNLWSNVTLNCGLRMVFNQNDTLLSWKVLLGEVLVVTAEFLLFCLVEKNNRIELFVLTLVANIITYSLSFII